MPSDSKKPPEPVQFVRELNIFKPPQTGMFSCAPSTDPFDGWAPNTEPPPIVDAEHVVADMFRQRNG